jgi:hypothetical protein
MRGSSLRWMNARPIGIAALLPLLIVSFAGCLDPDDNGGAKAFDALDAPVWQSGYQWTYDITSSYHSTYSEDGRPSGDSETESDAFTLTVINDTADFEGEPVYFLRSSERVDHPFMQGTLQAISKANLAVAGYGYSEDSMRMAPRAVPASRSPDMAYSSYYPVQPKDPCEGVTLMQSVEDEKRFPGFQFPIDDGQAWTGVWGEDNDMPQFTYTSKVRGITPVQVPAGVFPSVYVETEFVPAAGGLESNELPFQFRIRSESWYSADVRYLTKMIVSAEMTGTSPDGRFGPVSFDYVSTMQLKDFELTPGPGEPVDVVVQKAYDEDYARTEPTPGYAIVADKEMPLDLSADPVTVNLGLEQLEDYNYDGRIQARPDGVPQTVDIDHSTHEVVWMLNRYGDWQWSAEEIVGDTVSYTFDQGGRYQVQAHIRPIKCGESWRNYASADITTIMTRSYTLNMQPGVPATFKVGTFDVAPELSRLQIEWSMKPTAITAVDRGHLTLISPMGDRRMVTSSPYTESYVYPDGNWRMEWTSEQATVGDDVVVTVKTVYDPWYQ